MSKILRFDDSVKEALCAAFLEQLEKTTITAGTFEFKRSFNYAKGVKDSAAIMFTPEAFIKQLVLIQDFEKEIGWHGLIRRDQDNEFVFHVEDILVYPQQVTSCTITPSQEEYSHWHDKLSDEQFDLCKYHAHSHVNMTTTPSGVDSGFQKDILSTMGPESFYVFMIWNKRGDHWAHIYDNKNNVLFENSEISIGVDGGAFDTTDFLKQAKELVREEKITSFSGGGYGGGYGKNYPSVPKQQSYPGSGTQTAFPRFGHWDGDYYD